MTTTSPPVRSEDPENQRTMNGRCRCLDYCLVLSVILLTMVVGSFCVLYIVDVDRQHMESGAINTSIHEVQETRSAQLTMDTAFLKKTITKVKWQGPHVENNFVGKDFSYGNDELVVRKTGLYYVYTQLALTCVSMDCNEEGEVSLSILTNNNKTALLKLNTETNKSSLKKQLSSFTAGIKYLQANARIWAELDINHNYMSWQLDQGQNFLGLFWISDYRSENN